MKKPNAQAEPPSSPGELLRGSPAQLYFFLFINRLQAQAYSRGLLVPRGSSPPPPLTFLIDYKHKHTATGVARHVSHVRFFLFF